MLSDIVEIGNICFDSVQSRFLRENHFWHFVSVRWIFDTWWDSKHTHI